MAFEDNSSGDGEKWRKNQQEVTEHWILEERVRKDVGRLPGL